MLGRLSTVIYDGEQVGVTGMARRSSAVKSNLALFLNIFNSDDLDQSEVDRIP